MVTGAPPGLHTDPVTTEDVPDRLRAARSAEDLHQVWTTVEGLWNETLGRAARLTEEQRQTRVDGEWSLVETVRHLVFATDCWVGRMLLGLEDAHHPLGLPPTDHPDDASRELGIDLEARPSFGEAVVVLAERRGQVSGVFATLDDDALVQEISAAPAPYWGVETHTVEACVRTLLFEFLAHRGYAERDLATLAV